MDEFYRNAWLFLDHAEMILATPELFYVPVESGNGSVLGVYVEWWFNHACYGRDSNGNPLVYFVGNPMTGSHSCQSVTREGNVISRCPLRARWTKSAAIFQKLCDKYGDTPQSVEAMTLQAAVEYIKAHSTPEIVEQSRSKAHLLSLESEVEYLKGRLELYEQLMERQHLKVLRFYVSEYYDEIGKLMAEIGKCRERIAEYRMRTRPILYNSRVSLRRGMITGKEHQQFVGRVKKAIEELRSEEQQYCLRLKYCSRCQLGLGLNCRDIMQCYNEMSAERSHEV